MPGMSNKIGRLLRKGMANNLELHSSRDRVEGNDIILDGEGEFPKLVIILNKGDIKKYRIIKTKLGKFQLTK